MRKSIMLVLFLLLAFNAFADPEICDNLDNDGNSFVDDGLSFNFGTDVGECSFGVTDCINGAFVNTTQSVNPIQEICDGKDNDCDGAIDNGFNLGSSCVSSSNSCGDANTGSYICSLDGLSTVCSASRPAERPAWHQLCQSRKNWCGDYNFGLTDCNGVCQAIKPAERSNWLQPCWTVNACRITTTGITDCNGICSAVPAPVADSDMDAIPDCNDNCPTTYNNAQADIDDDGIGDICDPINDLEIIDEDTGNGGNTNTTNTTTSNPGTNTTNTTVIEVVTPPKSGGSSGGGGGGSRNVYRADFDAECFWNCSRWSSCNQGNETRYCTYYNCNENVSVPTIRTCQVIIEPDAEYFCKPDWNCTGWSMCENENQVRSCVDLNNCTYPEILPELSRACVKETENEESSNGFPWWILLLILLMFFMLFLFRRKDDKKGKKKK